MIGKWTVGVLSLYIFILVVRAQTPGWLSGVLLTASTAMLVISFALYVRRFLRTIHASNV